MHPSYRYRLPRVNDDSISWSEYTLYRTALDHFDAFEALHAVGTTKLLGDESVWYSEQFEAWNATAAFDGESVQECGSDD